MFFQVLPPSMDCRRRRRRTPSCAVVLAGADPDDVAIGLGHGHVAEATVASRSNWCSKVVPLLVVLRRPPEAVATQ